MLGMRTLCKGGVMMRWLGHLGRRVGTNDHPSNCFACFVCYGCVMGHLHDELPLHLHWDYYIVFVTCVIVPFRLLCISIYPVGSHAPCHLTIIPATSPLQVMAF